VVCIHDIVVMSFADSRQEQGAWCVPTMKA
jgi:hypothetical protein